MSYPVLFFIILLLLAIFIYITLYNGMVRARTKIEEGWAGIETQLKRRHDLIPSLLSAVKAALGHEATIIDKVVKARENAIKALASKNKQEVAEAEAVLSQGITGILGYTEDNPEITATENIQIFQRQLEETEDQIAASRRIYNSNVQDFNMKIQTFPGNLIAPIHKFTKQDSFALQGSDLKNIHTPPSVEFDA